MISDSGISAFFLQAGGGGAPSGPAGGVLTGSYPNPGINFSAGTRSGVLPVLYGGTGTTDRTLLDSANDVSVNWEQFTLEASGVVKYDWESGFFFMQNGFQIADFQQQFLMDSNSTVAVQWNERYLNDVNGDLCIDFDTRKMYDSNLNLSVDFDGFKAYNLGTGALVIDSVDLKLYSINSGQLCMDWNNGFLYDTSGITESLSWFNRELLNPVKGVVLDWASDISIRDGVDISFQTTTGSKIGTLASEKLSFWGKTPIVQPTTAIASATFVANAGTAINTASTFDGWKIDQVIRALINTGILA